MYEITLTVISLLQTTDSTTINVNVQNNPVPQIEFDVPYLYPANQKLLLRSYVSLDIDETCADILNISQNSLNNINLNYVWKIVSIVSPNYQIIHSNYSFIEIPAYALQVK